MSAPELQTPELPSPEPPSLEPPPSDPLSGDDADSDLLALPSPPSGRRAATRVLMAAVIVAAFGVAFSLRADVGYFFASASAVDLGRASELDPATLRSNTFVRVRGTPMASATVRYRYLVSGEAYAMFPLAGQRTVYVSVPEAQARDGRTEFSGRLVTFGQVAARTGAVRGYLSDTMGLPVTAESFVLFVDEAPASDLWALVVVALCALLAVADFWLFLRWFLPRPTGPR
jgi:hypothetical protein